MRTGRNIWLRGLAEIVGGSGFQALYVPKPQSPTVLAQRLRYSCGMKRDHAFRERQSLALNSAVAQRLNHQPDAVIERARATLARWKSLPGVWCGDLDKWEAILGQSNLDVVCDQVRRMLTGMDATAIRLRQSSPFSVQLAPRERWKILRETTTA